MAKTVPDIYREKYVAFIDLLGFSQLAEDADNDDDTRRRVITILGLFRETLCEIPATGMRLTQFSDCIVISVDTTPNGLTEMLESIDWLTSNLLQHDVLARGGLTRRGIHHDETNVFGPGMNEAHRLEQCEAKHPRVVLDERVVKDVRDAKLDQRIDIDSDGRAFVHYLRRFQYHDPTPQAGNIVMDGPANLIMNFVGARLVAKVNDSIKGKAEWLRDYWNRTVEPQGLFGGVVAGKTDRPNWGPTIVVRRLFDPNG